MVGDNTDHRQKLSSQFIATTMEGLEDLKKILLNLAGEQGRDMTELDRFFCLRSVLSPTAILYMLGKVCDKAPVILI